MTTHPTPAAEPVIPWTKTEWQLEAIRLARDTNALLAERDALREQVAELAGVASGALGYLQALPEAYRPDPAWFAPLRAALAKVRP